MATASLTATERARRVKLMIFDVDGVLTDGGLMFTAEGDTMKSFNSMDGHGAKLLREAGIDTAIITGRKSGIVAVRAKELKITHLYQGIENKPANRQHRRRMRLYGRRLGRSRRDAEGRLRCGARQFAP
jgi:3-deoxy-D-manno-octulosonate 8-phosphate phosphatase (KDO 8-P phosphatase)